MLGWIRNLFKPRSDGLRAVPGALTARQGDRVIYNMLDPTMQKFMGQCVGALKKAKIRAKGTGQFSIKIGEGSDEIELDAFWTEYADSGSDAVFHKLVDSAKRVLNVP